MERAAMPFPSDQQWKKGMREAFVACVSELAGQKLETAQQAYQTYEGMQRKLSKTLWVLLSKRLQVPSKVVHDYYHNSFSKMFCIENCKIQRDIEALFERRPNNVRRDVVNYILNELTQRYPGQHIHYQSIYQAVHYRLQKEQNQLAAKWAPTSVPICDGHEPPDRSLKKASKERQGYSSEMKPTVSSSAHEEKKQDAAAVSMQELVDIISNMLNK